MASPYWLTARGRMKLPWKNKLVYRLLMNGHPWVLSCRCHVVCRGNCHNVVMAVSPCRDGNAMALPWHAIFTHAIESHGNGMGAHDAAREQSQNVGRCARRLSELPLVGATNISGSFNRRIPLPGNERFEPPAHFSWQSSLARQPTLSRLLAA